MKKINLLLLLLVTTLGLTTLSSCDPKETEKADPTIDFVAEGGSITTDKTGLGINQEFQFIINVDQSIDTKKNLSSFKISSITNNATRIDTLVDKINSDHKKMTFTFRTDTVYSSEEVFTFLLTDKAGVTVKKTIKLTTMAEPAPAETDLDATEAITWTKCASTKDDISMYGLELGLNETGGNYPINKTGDKLVELTAAEWTSITTKEALKAAVEAGTDLASTSGYVWTSGTTSYDKVYATQNGTNYYMINITQGVSTLESCGTQIILTGEVKK